MPQCRSRQTAERSSVSGLVANEDGELTLYGEAVLQASQDLRYLLNRGYKRKNLKTLLALVGDRYRLNGRQRTLLGKAVFSDAESEQRKGKLVVAKGIEGRTLGIDGYNVLLTVESALQGEPILLADDGLIRDIAGKSSRYKPGEATIKALDLILATLRQYPPREVTALFDERMSKSLRLAREFTERLEQRGLSGGGSTSRYPDEEILAEEVVSTSDSAPIDRATRVFDLAGHIIREVLHKELIELSRAPAGGGSEPAGSTARTTAATIGRAANRPTDEG